MNETFQIVHATTKNRSMGILLPKLFIIIVIVLLMWLLVVGSASLLLEFDPLWTGLSLGTWSLIISAFVGVFIIFDIILYMNTEPAVPQFQEFTPIEEKAAVEYKEGKWVYEFTHPVGSKGGIYSKTYLQIDEGSIIRIRHQMFTADEIWTEEEDNPSSSES